MSDPVEEYYDPMAEDYSLLFDDWRETVLQESETIARLIHEHLGDAVRSVLDCACGIGSQSIALALKGYQVWGADVSEASIARARREAEHFQVRIDFRVADMRALAATISREFDLVVAFDNALPHCLTDDELALAARSVFARVRPGGLFMASMRDYDRLATEKPRFVDPHVYEGEGIRRLVFQVWDWAPEGDLYRVEQFLMLGSEAPGSEWETRSYQGEYRSLQRDQLSQMLAEAGFVDVRWRLPAESGYYQPVVVARRPAGG